MTDYNSNLKRKKMRHRGMYAGQPYQVAGRIFLPSGTVLTTSDILKFVPVGENQSIRRVTLEVIGDTSTIAGSIGHFQILDDAGNPVVVEHQGPLGEAGSKFASPASVPAAYLAAGQLDGYTETIINPTAKLAGPVDVGIAITTGGTIAADTTIFLGVELDGETSTVLIEGDQNPDNSYLLD